MWNDKSFIYETIFLQLCAFNHLIKGGSNAEFDYSLGLKFKSLLFYFIHYCFTFSGQLDLFDSVIRIYNNVCIKVGFGSSYYMIVSTFIWLLSPNLKFIIDGIQVSYEKMFNLTLSWIRLLIRDGWIISLALIFMHESHWSYSLMLILF